jgi:16S rRNA (guanine(966)-N(2))-methyltransferase RsmD
LGPAVEGAVFVDAYAGTGAVGLEAVSRGAKLAVFLEESRTALAVLRHNIAVLRMADRARVLEGPAIPAFGRLSREGLQPQIVFLDPPYSEAAEYRKALEAVAAFPQALVVAEHHRKSRPAGEGLECTRVLEQGDSALSFYRVKPRSR